MSVKQKYLKDENGEIVSPITSANSVIFNDGTNAEDSLPRFKVLFTGNVAIKNYEDGTESVITVSDDIKNYDILLMIRNSTVGIAYSTDGFINAQSFVNSNYSDFANERWNVFTAQVYRKSATQVAVKNNLYTGIHKDGSSFSVNNYNGAPLEKIIGIKL